MTSEEDNDETRCPASKLFDNFCKNKELPGSEKKII